MAGEPSFMSQFISTHSIPEESLKHFASVEWTNKYLSNPLYEAIPTFSRVSKDSGEDYFFSKTISTPSTIPHMVTLQRKDYSLPEESPKGTITLQPSQRQPIKAPENPDCIILMTLGRLGLNGHPSVLHGGVTCAILDEMLGLCAMLHQQHISGPRNSLFTVGLNVTYRAQVPTPSDVVVRVWLVGREGRKWLLRGQILDNDGVVMVDAEGLWVLTKRQERL